MSACFCWLSILEFLILVKRPQILGPFLSLGKPSHYPICKGSYYVFGWSSRLSHQFSSKILKGKQSCCFQLEEVSSQSVTRTPTQGMWRKVGYRWPADAGRGSTSTHGPPAPLPSLGSLQFFEGGSGVRVSLNEEVLIRLHPPLPFDHPQKGPKLL